MLARMTTLGRRLLRLLPKVGLHVTDISPGNVLLARRPELRVTTLGSNSWLVSKPGSSGTKPLTGGVSLVGDVRGTQTIPLAAGAYLLLRPEQARRDLWKLQKRLDRYLVPEHVAWILRTYQVNCVVDAGAHVGGFAKSLRRVGYTGRIASFEPVPHLLEELKAAAADDPEWRVYPFALGQENITVPMHVVPRGGGGPGTTSSILPPSEFGTRTNKRFRETHTEEITVRRLDGMLDEVLTGLEEPRPYLKLDTQGYDVEAFAGAGERIVEFVGMQSEVALLRLYAGMPRMPEAIEVYESAGFEVTGMFPVTREKQTGRVVEFDCVMVRAEAALR